MISLAVPARPAGIAAVAGGLTLTALGLGAAFDPDFLGSAWFVLAGIAAILLVVALLGLRTATADVRGARAALTVAAAAMTLFALAHFFALVDQDTALLLFSVFMILASAGIIVAGIAIARTSVWPGTRRFVPLLCGVWPLATIPAAAAIGDLPHFLAITCWGGCWVALGVALLALVSPALHSTTQRAY